MIKTIFTLVLVFISFSQIISQSKSEKKISKKENKSAEYKLLKEVIESGKYVFTANWSFPQGGRRIDLTTNQNQVKINNKDAVIYLPYFGSVQSSRAALGGGIEFEGKLENYKVDFNDKKMRVYISFSAKTKTEYFDFSLFLNQNGSASLTVNSNNRSSIGYEGIVKKTD